MALSSSLPYLPRLNENGFTLLELLIVVFILSALAFSTISLTNNADEQFRYEDTRTRLQNIRRAIVGSLEAALSGQKLMSGYIVDNGGLPANIKALVVAPAGFDAFGGKEPLFDKNPDAAGFDNGGGKTDLDEPNETLFKGHRGDYLTVPPGDGTYRDGWGNVHATAATDALNFGWAITASATSYTTTSIGSDGVAGGAAGFEKDMADTVGQEDWTQDVTGWQVKVTNSSGGTENNMRVSLLVYVNDAGTKRWKRLTTDRVSSLTDGSSFNFTFEGAAGELPGISPVIPIGQHLIIIDDDGGDHDPHTNDDKAFKDSSNLRVTQKVNFYPHATLPTVEVIIK